MLVIQMELVYFPSVLQADLWANHVTPLVVIQLNLAQQVAPVFFLFGQKMNFLAWALSHKFSLESD